MKLDRRDTQLAGEQTLLGALVPMSMTVRATPGAPVAPTGMFPGRSQLLTQSSSVIFAEGLVRVFLPVQLSEYLFGIRTRDLRITRP